MARKTTPKGFTARDFELFILDCAIRNREGFIDAYSGCDDESAKAIKSEANEEIKCMHARMKRIRNKAL